MTKVCGILLAWKLSITHRPRENPDDVFSVEKAVFSFR